MTRHPKKPQGLRTSKVGIPINANGLAWFRRYLEAMLCIAAVMRRECPLWGYQRAFREVRPMSALHLKADITHALVAPQVKKVNFKTAHCLYVQSQIFFCARNWLPRLSHSNSGLAVEKCYWNATSAKLRSLRECKRAHS